MKFKRFMGFGLALTMALSSLQGVYGENKRTILAADRDLSTSSSAVYADEPLKAMSWGDSYEVEGGYIYFDESTGTITGCDDDVTSAVIPDEINGVEVTSIDYFAFNGCYSLISVTIPRGVTIIDRNTFENCSSLTSVTILGNVTSIGDLAFEDCSNLTSITIPDSVTSIGDSAFNGCSRLASITIPDSVTSIGDCVFSDCSSLTSITIPSSVTGIGSYVFDGCSRLTSINVEETNSDYKSFGGVLFDKDMSEIIRYPQGKTGASYTIPSGVTRVCAGAFKDCSSLTSITIPDSVTWIESSAFKGCSGLTSIKIPYSVANIGGYVFDGCSSLTSINVEETNRYYKSPEGVLFDKNMSEIIRYPQGKTGASYIIPDSVTSIGSSAFKGCSSLTSITIPDSVTSIGIDGFEGCSSLTSITIPDGVKRIGDSAFDGCSSLASITIPDSVTSIGIDGFEGCSSLTSITIPDSVTSIGIDGFEGCSSLTSVTIPYGVTDIEGSLFEGCSRLTSITIPGSVTSIGGFAFKDCSSLTSITIPGSAASIDESAFDGCVSLTSINVEETNSNYKSLDGVLFNKDMTELIKYPEGKAEANYTVPDSVADICDFAFEYCSKLVSVTIPGSVANIGMLAFDGCSGLTSVSISDGVTSIGESAFYYCDSLTSITIPGSVTSIEGAFDRCDSLTSVNVEETYSNYKSLDGVLFSKDMSRLIMYPKGKTEASYTVPDSVTDIDDNAFLICSSLTDINVPETNKYYKTQDGVLFNKDMSRLIAYPAGKAEASYTIPDSVTSINIGGFSYCSNLMSVVIPDSVTNIGICAFWECNSLTKVSIPKDIKIIRQCVFYNCNSLKDVYYGGSVDDWNKIVISFDNECLTNANIYFGSVLPEASTESTTEISTETTTVTATETSTETTTVTATEASTETTTVSGIQSVNGEYLTYNEGMDTITSCGSVVARVIIPEEMNGVKPVAIGDSAFSGCADLEIIAIPESVTSIRGNAFAGCTDGMKVWCEKGSYADNAALYPVSVTFKYFEPVIYGDADGGDLLTAGDSAEILQKVLNNSYKMPVEEKTPYWSKKINVDGDDIITASDASFVLQKVLDSSFEFPSEKLK